MTSGRRRHRTRADVLEQTLALRAEVTAALARLPTDEPAVVDAIWRGEALGTLLWALQAIGKLPPYDRPFDTEAVATTGPGDRPLRDAHELDAAYASARLWHWRARTAVVQSTGDVPLPDGYASVGQLIAATAMRGAEQDLLPAPLRGDFSAYGKVYGRLSPAEQAEAHSIALERQHALVWLCGEGASWGDVPLDT